MHFSLTHLLASLPHTYTSQPLILNSLNTSLSLTHTHTPLTHTSHSLMHFSLTHTSLFPQNIQSTNWQSMRFKPPPPNSSIGWRVEFRPMEIQLTDFENAAFVVFVVLLTRAILSFKLNLYIPITKVTTTTPMTTPLSPVVSYR